MRILFTSHEPLDGAVSGRFVDSAARGLASAGHQVRILCVDDEPGEEVEPNVRRVVCHATDRRAPFPHAMPTFGGVASPTAVAEAGRSNVTFAALSDRQLSDYRDLLRAEFDREIDLYDPCIVHVQHVWLFGHLALEAGIPYVLSAHPQEFEVARTDSRYRRYMQETAENACRILSHGAAARAVNELVGDLEGRVVPFPLPSNESLGKARWWESLPALYRASLIERFGKLPDHCVR
ncbi:MAG: glycosyltransferase [Planctomycetia bacterium]|nr:glycosyltransferase [Planctomycetia bacterium]